MELTLYSTQGWCSRDTLEIHISFFCFKLLDSYGLTDDGLVGDRCGGSGWDSGMVEGANTSYLGRWGRTRQLWLQPHGIRAFLARGRPLASDGGVLTDLLTNDKSRGLEQGGFGSLLSHPRFLIASIEAAERPSFVAQALQRGDHKRIANE